MRSRRAWRLRKASDELESYVAGADRFVDMGVVLHVVDRDPYSDPEGEGFLPGAPPLRILRTLRFGGLLDRRLRAFVAPSVRPVVWYCSELQLPLILHGDDLPDRLLARGAMGAGKTQVLAMRLILRVFFFTGFICALGATAPTSPRLSMIREAMSAKMPPDWATWSERRSEYVFAQKIRVQLVSTHQQSHAGGSPLQGYNWADCSSDEMQDSLAVDSDIEARGRSCPKGPFKRFCSATAKDSSDYRTWVDFIKQSGEWGIYQLKGPDNPFTRLSYWEKLKRTMSARDYARKVEAQDISSERMTYPAWSRAVNVRPRPRVGAKDVTSLIVRQKTGNPRHELLGGCDPGNLKNVTEFLKAYQIGNDPDPYWWVVAELTTGPAEADPKNRGATVEHHGLRVLEVARQWGCNVRPDGPQLHMRCDPYGKNAKHPDKDVYRILGRLGIDIRSAEYSKTGTGNGQIGVDARIGMVNRLLCDASQRSRLFIDVDAQGLPVAPELVKSLEESERDEMGRAETERKDQTDRSHWPAGLAHAVWPWEKEAAANLRAAIRKELG